MLIEAVTERDMIGRSGLSDGGVLWVVTKRNGVRSSSRRDTEWSLCSLTWSGAY